MAGLRTASTWVRISLVAIILAIILFVVGFATVAWVVAHHIRGHGSRQYDWSYWSIGLWEEFVCPLNKHRSCYEVVSNRNLKLWFHAGQAMECLGLIFMVIAFIILLLYICSNSFRRRSYLIGNVVCTFLSVTFIVIGLVIFITNFEGLYHDIGWSMGLAIAAAICAFISGIMSLLELCSR